MCLKSGILGSEELEEPFIIKGTENKYACLFDPLDGSSNIDANVRKINFAKIQKKKDFFFWIDFGWNNFWNLSNNTKRTMHHLRICSNQYVELWPQKL